MSRGKRRLRCRSCSRFFIHPEDRAPRPSPKPKERSTAYYRGPAPKELPSAGHLILKLRSIAGRLGRAPTTTEITQLSKEGKSYPLGDYYAVFGSFLAALEKARIKKRYRQTFNEQERERMLDQLRRLSRRLKRPLYGRDFIPARRKGLVSPMNHFQIAFGTIPNAIALAGVAPKKKYTREEMIAVLRQIDATLDRPVEKKDITALNHAGKGPSVNVIVREFGSLAKARFAAGIQRKYDNEVARTTYWRKYTRAKLIAQLKALGKRLGRQPTYKEINHASKEGRCASAATFSNIFGSLPEAYHAAGFHETPKNHRRYTDKEMIAALLKLREDLGHFPTFHEIKAASKANRCPSNGTIRLRLGSLTELKAKYGE